MTLTKEEIGARLRARRKQRNWTLIELKERSGINNGSLSKIERGAQSVTSETLIRLCEAYGIDLDQLLAPISDQKEGDDTETRAIDPLMLHDLMDNVETASIVKVIERILDTLPAEVENKVRRRLCQAPKRASDFGGEYFIYQLKHTPIQPASQNE